MQPNKHLNMAHIPNVSIYLYIFLIKNIYIYMQ